MSLGHVDFVELYMGVGRVTYYVGQVGCVVGEGFDVLHWTYDRQWDFTKRADRADCAWLLVYALKPKALHAGTPCTDMCIIGDRVMTEKTKLNNAFTMSVAEHQRSHSLGASVENPKTSLFWELDPVVREFGTKESPNKPWGLCGPMDASSELRI